MTDINPNWWCEKCQKEVPPIEVTYEETHDIRSGGCGYLVFPEKPVNLTDLESELAAVKAENEKLREHLKEMSQIAGWFMKHGIFFTDDDEGDWYYRKADSLKKRRKDILIEQKLEEK